MEKAETTQPRSAPLDRGGAQIPRAEVVGSLIRPKQLLDVVAEVYRGGRTAVLDGVGSEELSRLREVEDGLIAAAVERQIEAGLDVVTDGEFRRAAYSNSFYDAVEGLERNPEPMRFFADDGTFVEYAAPPIVTKVLRKVGSPGAHEAAYLSSLTDHPFKVTFPAGSRWCLPFVHRLDQADGAYGSLQELVADAIAIQKELIADAIAAGCRYIQLDFPIYPMLVDQRWLAGARAQGVDPDELMTMAIEADRAVVADIPSDVRTGLHICRGNHRSRWLFEGSLDPIAEQVFGELPYDSFLVEWEDVEREGGYDSIRFVPKGRIAVMGLVSSKRPRLETDDEVIRRLKQAAEFLDISQLALSTQCGFASTWHGNEIDEEIQWRKLELVGRVADRFWS
jgi:5-methyltetrahydropteroyltriglutamate--homocysteine methyltransferase